MGRSLKRDIMDAKLAMCSSDNEKYFDMLCASPYRKHRTKAQRIIKQAETITKMQEEINATKTQEPTES